MPITYTAYSSTIAFVVSLILTSPVCAAVQFPLAAVAEQVTEATALRHTLFA